VGRYCVVGWWDEGYYHESMGHRGHHGLERRFLNGVGDEEFVE
jgi:hypothetical protein